MNNASWPEPRGVRAEIAGAMERSKYGSCGNGQLAGRRRRASASASERASHRAPINNAGSVGACNLEGVRAEISRSIHMERSEIWMSPAGETEQLARSGNASERESAHRARASEPIAQPTMQAALLACNLLERSAG